MVQKYNQGRYRMLLIIKIINLRLSTFFEQKFK